MPVVVRRIHICFSFFITTNRSGALAHFLADAHRFLPDWFSVGFRMAGEGEIESGVTFGVTPPVDAMFCPNSRCQCQPDYFFSMPLVAPLPGLVAQQKAESSPQALQLCLSSTMSPLAWPTTVKVDLQPAHA
jgi:hypothetical protein